MLPLAGAVQGVVAASVRLPGVRGTATTREAGDDTTDRAQLHPRIVDGVAGAVYSPAVLRLWGDAPLIDPHPGSRFVERAYGP